MGSTLDESPPGSDLNCNLNVKMTTDEPDPNPRELYRPESALANPDANPNLPLTLANHAGYRQASTWL